MLKTIYIEGMHCQHCVAAVTEALENLQGTSDVNVSLETNTATLNTELADELLKSAVEDIGFDVTAIK